LDPTRPIHGGRFRAAAIVGLLAVLLRLVVIAAPPRDLDYGGYVWVEELLRGNIAWEVLRGPVLPLHDHQIPFWGGMTVIGFLAVPTFALLGPSLFALRMAQLPFAFLLAFAAFLLLDRIASRRAAWIGGLLLAFAPPGLVFTSVLAQGTHCEQTAIALLLLWLYAEHVQKGLTSLRLAFAVGLVFGFHVSFGAAQVLPMIVLFDFLRDRLFFARREFAARAAGIVIGALPFVRYEILSGGAAHVNYGHGPLESLTPESLRASIEKLARLPLDDFPRSFWFEDSLTLPGRVLGIALALALVALYLIALWSRRAQVRACFSALRVWRPGARARDAVALDPVVLVLALPAVWLVLFALTPLGVGPRDWVIGFRYLLVPGIFLVLTGAIGADALASRSTRARTLVAAGTAGVGLLCAVSTLMRCDFENARALRNLPGARPEGVARIVFWKHGTEPGPLRDFVANVREKRTVAEQEDLYYELAMLLRLGLERMERNKAAPQSDRNDPRAALALVRENVPESFRPWFEVPESGPPPLLPARRPEFGRAPH
jgi:hypothetical protein